MILAWRCYGVPARVYVLPKFETSSRASTRSCRSRRGSCSAIGSSATWGARGPWRAGLRPVAMFLFLRTDGGKMTRHESCCGFPPSATRSLPVAERFCRILGAMLRRRRAGSRRHECGIEATNNRVYIAGLDAAHVRRRSAAKESPLRWLRQRSFPSQWRRCSRSARVRDP